MDKFKPLYPPLISQREVVTEWGESLRAEEHIDTLLFAVKNLMQNMDLPAEEAMAVLEISESDRKTLLPLLQ